MANIIRIKRSNTSTGIPTSLAYGELAVSTVDQKLWVGSPTTVPVLISDINGAFIYRGDWTSSVSYIKNNVVKNGALFYFAVTNISQGIATPPGVGAVDWQVFSNSNLTNVENTALSTWAGSTNLTTVGAATTRNLTIAPLSQSSTTAFKCLTVTAPAHTNLTASSSCTDIHINLARTVQFAFGSLPAQTAIKISAPTYDIAGLAAAGNATTVQIDSAPIATGNVSWGFSSALNILTGVPTGVGIVITSATSQSVDSFRIYNSTFQKPFSISNTGAVVLGPFGTAIGNTNELRFLELEVYGQNYVGFKAPNSIAGNTIWTLPAVDGTAGQVLSTNASGVLSWATVSGGSSGATLNAVSAATATQTGIANGDFGIKWNWARTTNTTSALELGETTAATGGTSTSGIPNQVGLKLSTLAASTMSPLSVYSRGSHVFSVSPTSTQILAATANDSFPTYSFANAPNCGLANPLGNYLRLRADEILVENTGGVEFARFSSNRFMVNTGTTSAPGYSFFSENTTGLSNPNTGAIAVSINSVENSRFIASAFQPLRSSFDTIAYAINSRKSRGTDQSPLVITTGDDLLTMSGFGYVGTTNTYLEASRIKFGSTGTISDTSTGIGGTIDFLTRDVGGAVTSKFTMTNKGELLVAGAAGTTGQVLTSTGSGAAPTWQTIGTLVTPVITGLREIRSVVAANNIDTALGNYFTKTITANTTFTVTNTPTTGIVGSFILDLTNGGAFTITWWAGVKWASATAPTLTASGRDCLGFFTHDGGATWTGLLLGKDLR